MRDLRIVAIVAAWLLTGEVSAQSRRSPTGETVRTLRAAYSRERDQAVAEKIERHFIPGTIERADDLARKADEAAKAERWFQASDLYRQARWQLPYVPVKLPEHVSRVIGNFRLRHGMDVSAIAFSPDGSLLATGGSDRLVKVWDLANGRERLTFTRHSELIRAVAFSPDGKIIASAGMESEVRLWSAEDGTEIRTLAGPGIDVKALAFSPDGKYLASSHVGKQGAAGPSVTIHEVATGELKRSIQDFRQAALTVAFNAAGSILAVGVNDGTSRLYEFPKIVEKATTPEFWGQQESSGPTYHLSFSPDDRTLVRCGADGVRLYSVPQPDQEFRVSTPRRTIVHPVQGQWFQIAQVTADSKTLVTGSSDGILRLYDIENGQMVSSLAGQTGPIRSLAIDPQGSQIASAGSDYMVRLWDFEVVAQTREFGGHGGAVWSASFDGTGRRLVSACADQLVRVWDRENKEPILTLKGHVGPVTLALFTPDGKAVVSAGSDRLIKMWDAARGTPLRDLAGHAGTVTALDISPDGTRIVSGGADRQVKVWNASTGKEVLSIDKHPSVVADVAFHPKGDRFAVGNVDQTISLYDLGGKLLHRWSAHGVGVSGVAFSPDGRWLASCGADNAVRVWPMATPGQDPVLLAGHTGPVSDVAFRKDGEHLVSCGADLTIKLWKLEPGGAKELQTYRGHRDWVTSVTLSRDGYYIASASVDRSVKVWEITSKDLPSLPEHTGSVDTVAFSPNGKMVASGGSDRTIKLWNRETGAELVTIRGHASNIVSLAFSPDSKILISSSYDRSIRLWDPITGKELPRSPTQQQSWTRLMRPSSLVAMTPDGKTLLAWISGDERHTSVVAYDLEGNEKGTVNDEGRSVVSLCFSADARTAATGASNGSVRLFDLTKRTLMPGGDWFFFDEKVSVADLAVSPDSKTIVVTSEQGDIKIADIAQRKVRMTLKGHPGKILGCIFSPDGKRFATWDVSNTVKVWDVATGKELRSWNFGPILSERTSYVLSFAFSPDSKHLATGNANTTIFLLDVP